MYIHIDDVGTFVKHYLICISYRIVTEERNIVLVDTSHAARRLSEHSLVYLSVAVVAGLNLLTHTIDGVKQ